jgi:hypothetical protein
MSSIASTSAALISGSSTSLRRNSFGKSAAMSLRLVLRPPLAQSHERALALARVVVGERGQEAAERAADGGGVERRARGRKPAGALCGVGLVMGGNTPPSGRRITSLLRGWRSLS